MLTDWIEVGEVSAERDQFLKDYFYDNGVSSSVVNNNKQYLLLGRKGAGKTAVFMHLTQKPKAVFKAEDTVVGLSLQSYKWKAHQLLSDEARAGGFQHRDSWRFVLCVESIRAIVTHLDKIGIVVPRPIDKASKLLGKIFNSPVPSWTELLGSKLFSLASAKLPDLGASEEGVSVGGGEITFEQIKEDENLKNQLRQNIENLTDWLEDCLKSCPENIRVFLAFDRLDEAWISDFIEQSKLIICGLLHASEHVLQTFGGRIRPLVFLREDIFYTFDINDRNKLRKDCGESLRWNQEAIEKLALERINFFATRSGNEKLSSLKDIFLEKEMRRRATPVKHIYNRTMNRPRDMVAFLSGAFKTAKTENLCESEQNKIKTQAIYMAEPEYSEYLFEELSDEWRNQNQSFLDYLRTLENLRYAAISTDELQEALESKGLAKDRAEFRNILRFLFENSIVGITVGESKQWRYRCFYPNQAFVDSDVIKVHPGLIKRLGLTEGASERASNIAKTTGIDTENEDE